TDGGRMALTVFGRRGMELVNNLTWWALLLGCIVVPFGSSLFFQTPWTHNNEVLISAFVANTLSQRDKEIPCRDETEPLDLGRSLVALVVWFVALLVIIPL
ncbi:MAG TPA: hypothetical protein VD905_03205, partial [Flavobacteriales bacterium]|nr:hypothetical protein [Flavobacteriales bacterium]